MAERIKLALVGIGKIARDQHLPAIAADNAFELVAAVSRSGRVEGVPNFNDIAALIESGLPVDAVSLCTPPVGRHRIAAQALAAGLHVMLEKPPGATLAEVHQLQAQAAAGSGRSLFATWHSRHAAGVDAARAWLADKQIKQAAIVWREDIRVWHPGQEWILEAGGLGVFDPGINALSIVTSILPGALRLESAKLVFPAGRGAPIAAGLAMVLGEAAPVSADFDFRPTWPQSWDITVETDRGTLMLTEGGARLWIDGEEQRTDGIGEYPALYRRFAELVAAGRSDCDLRPMALVADAFLLGERTETDPFAF
ncbi:D-galactose 1-dehydrogenase [Novosphingobium sediminis]|uniref:D-galactose 1-dehydrogenase n=1 Tax=Novosphingobium sediminis TaxID=707214 RepID=A0A512APG7_9SPHN|nr:Gfo/Idh/MocA family oxidoreductase [Novosphingobium sediminis]GEO01598.1 D-galactose 1-dehydrogenase [Novosphingobium sediminis]